MTLLAPLFPKLAPSAIADALVTADGDVQRANLALTASVRKLTPAHADFLERLAELYVCSCSHF